MAVAFDAKVERNWNSQSTSDSWSHTCTGSDRYLIVAIGSASLGTPTMSATYNGVSMTSLGVSDNTTFGSSVQGKAQLFGLANPASGSNTVQVTFSGNNHFGGAASISYTGVHQTVSTGSAVTDKSAAGSFSTASVTITDSVANDMVVAAIVTESGGTITAGDTQRLSQAASGYNGAASDAPGAASVVMDYSWGGSTSYSMVGIALLQSAAGASVALSGSAATPNSGTQAPGTSIEL